MQVLLIVVMWVALRTGAPAPVKPADFDRDVKPILAAKCQPCHFPGGTMHERLPFDQQKTILHLGTKLFSRIKKAEDQAVIRRFLAEHGQKTDQ
jgi:hypothetical protein